MKISPNDFARTLLENIETLYEGFTSENGRIAILDEWTSRSSYAEGKSVTVTTASESFTGTTAGLEPSGALRVERPDGTI